MDEASGTIQPPPQETIILCEISLSCVDGLILLGELGDYLLLCPETAAIFSG
jgi:hypothetical protein